LAERLKLKKILFICQQRLNRSPGQRFRFEQYIDFLASHGFQSKLAYLLSAEDDKIFYSKGKHFKKAIIFFKILVKRLKDVLISFRYDTVFIFREAFFVGPAWFEFLLSLSSAKVIFDFDDAIWIPNVSEANKSLIWLKNFKKIKHIIKMANMIFAGNQYLADYALQFNKNVKIIPTTIDTDSYRRSAASNEKNTICIGWTGSQTTIQHFDLIVPVFKKIKNKYKEKIAFKVVVNGKYVNDDLKIIGTSWSKERELEELLDFDIAIMPLPNDEWAKGKCGLKALQCMALNIPVVISPVGVNMEIIQDGVNGFLADSEEEWVQKLSQLIDSQELREEMGRQARQTVVEKYSVESQKERYLKFIKNI